MRPISLRRSYFLVSALILTAPVVGCDSARTDTPPASAAAPAVVDLVTRTGNFTAGQKTITGAEDRLVARCMAAAGMSYVVGRPTSVDTTTDYGLYAQHTGKQADPTADKTTNDYYLAHLPDAERAAYLTALRGPEQAAVRLSDGHEITYSTQGCEAAARINLYGDLQTQVKVFYVPQIVDKAVQKQVQQNPRYLTALTAWRRCMASADASYQSPADARRQVNALYEKTGPTARTHRREIAVATLDHSCATTTPLAATEAALVREALTALPGPDQRELTKLTTSWRRTVEAATSTP